MAEVADWGAGGADAGTGTGAGAGTARASRPRLAEVHFPVDSASQGVVTGAVRWLLRAEGFAILMGALALYTQFGASWGFFAAAFLLPDLALLAYLAGPRTGALVYNTTHSMLGPLASTAFGVLMPSPLLAAAGLVWAAHVGLDRSLGLGLKYARGFASTHLGHIGRPDPW